MDDVLDVFEAERDADHVGGDAAADLLLVGDLLVGGAPGVDDEGLCVADVGEVRAQLEVVDDGSDLVDVARDAERQHAALALGENLLRQRVVGVRLQPGVVDPGDAVVGLEPAGQREGVFDVARAAQRNRLEPLQEQPRVERRHARAQVAHLVHPQLRRERLVAVRVPEPHPVVPVGGLGEAGEFARRRPVEVPAVDHDAAHAGAVPADPFRAAVRHDVRAELDRLAQVPAHAERVVHDQRDAGLVAHGRDRRDVWHVELRVADRLDVHPARLVVDRRLNLGRVLALHELAHDLELFHVHPELWNHNHICQRASGKEKHGLLSSHLVERPAVQVHCADVVLARLADGRDGHELRGVT